METLLPLITFVVASTVTPGPNNLMVLASGANSATMDVVSAPGWVPRAFAMAFIPW